MLRQECFFKTGLLRKGRKHMSSYVYEHADACVGACVCWRMGGWCTHARYAIVSMMVTSVPLIFPGLPFSEHAQSGRPEGHSWPGVSKEVPTLDRDKRVLCMK